MDFAKDVTIARFKHSITKE